MAIVEAAMPPTAAQAAPPAPATAPALLHWRKKLSCATAGWINAVIAD